MSDTQFPGPPGFHMPSGTISNPNELETNFTVNLPGRSKDSKYKEKKVIKQSEEIQHLNQYTGYFTTEEGDFPVSVVASSIKEAAKILAMPGVFGEDVDEPQIIKFIKGKIAVSIPVRTTGFNVVIDPTGAEESGAYATPAHADVKNGTEVIFTAHEPFGWKFIGWYKGDQLLSTDKVCTIEVYDPYSSLIQFTAKYEINPVIRSGKYLELRNRWYFDLNLEGYGILAGQLAIHTSTAGSWFYNINSSEAPEDGELILGLELDKTVVHPEGDEFVTGMTVKLVAKDIGFELIVQTITWGGRGDPDFEENAFGWTDGDGKEEDATNLVLKWLN